LVPEAFILNKLRRPMVLRAPMSAQAARRTRKQHPSNRSELCR
jgi:hypothetical protein